MILQAHMLKIRRNKKQRESNSRKKLQHFGHTIRGEKYELLLARMQKILGVVKRRMSRSCNASE